MVDNSERNGEVPDLGPTPGPKTSSDYARHTQAQIQKHKEWRENLLRDEKNSHMSAEDYFDMSYDDERQNNFPKAALSMQRAIYMRLSEPSSKIHITMNQRRPRPIDPENRSFD